MPGSTNEFGRGGIAGGAFAFVVATASFVVIDPFGVALLPNSHGFGGEVDEDVAGGDEVDMIPSKYKVNLSLFVVYAVAFDGIVTYRDLVFSVPFVFLLLSP